MQVARETADAPRRPEHVAEKRGDVDIKGMMMTTYYYHAAVVMGRAFRGPRRRGSHCDAGGSPLRQRRVCESRGSRTAWPLRGAAPS